MLMVAGSLTMPTGCEPTRPRTERYENAADRAALFKLVYLRRSPEIFPCVSRNAIRRT